MKKNVERNFRPSSYCKSVKQLHRKLVSSFLLQDYRYKESEREYEWRRGKGNVPDNQNYFDNNVLNLSNREITIHKTRGMMFKSVHEISEDNSHSRNVSLHNTNHSFDLQTPVSFRPNLERDISPSPEPPIPAKNSNEDSRSRVHRILEDKFKTLLDNQHLGSKHTPARSINMEGENPISSIYKTKPNINSSRNSGIQSRFATITTRPNSRLESGCDPIGGITCTCAGCTNRELIRAKEEARKTEKRGHDEFNRQFRAKNEEEKRRQQEEELCKKATHKATLQAAMQKQLKEKAYKKARERTENIGTLTTIVDNNFGKDYKKEVAIMKEKARVLRRQQIESQLDRFITPKKEPQVHVMESQTVIHKKKKATPNSEIMEHSVRYHLEDLKEYRTQIREHLAQREDARFTSKKHQVDHREFLARQRHQEDASIRQQQEQAVALQKIQRRQLAEELLAQVKSKLQNQHFEKQASREGATTLPISGDHGKNYVCSMCCRKCPQP